MTFNEAEVKIMLKEYSSMTYYKKRWQEEINEFLQEYNDYIEGEQLQAQQYDSVNVQTNNISDKVPQAAEGYRKLLEKFAQKREEKEAKYNMLIDIINNLPEELCWIIKDRYKYRKSYRQIGRETHQDFSTVCRKEQKAIKIIARKLATNTTK